MILTIERELDIPVRVLKHIKYLIEERLETLVLNEGQYTYYISHWNDQYVLEVSSQDPKVTYTFTDQSIFERIASGEIQT